MSPGATFAIKDRNDDFASLAAAPAYRKGVLTLRDVCRRAGIQGTSRQLHCRTVVRAGSQIVPPDGPAAPADGIRGRLNRILKLRDGGTSLSQRQITFGNHEGQQRPPTNQLE